MNKQQIQKVVTQTIQKDPDRDYIQSISLFGSFLHGDATKKSDIDLLIDLKKSTGFFTLIAIQNRLEDNLGRPVQLMTEKSISRYFRPLVIKEAERIYTNEPASR